MALLHGILGLPDTDRSFVNTIGQRVVYEAAQQLLERYNADLAAQESVFLETDTEEYKLRYKLPGAGRLQRRGGLGESGAVKAGGSWDVAFPLEDFGAQLSGDLVSLAYMTLDEFERQLRTVYIQDANTRRFEMLKALFNNTQRTFVDPNYGSLAIEPLANGDSVLYPPVLGSEAEATDNHYIESNYAATAISNTNNPYVTVKDELEEHFGAEQGGSNIVAFINPAEVPETEALADFDPVNDRFTMPGANTDQIMGAPSVPGRVIGRVNGVWVAEWRWIPANYLLATHLDAPRPLMRRVDPAATGLPRGLALMSEDEAYPFRKAHYANRFGIGVGNRLNGVVIEFGTGGTYTIPTAFA